MSNESWSDDLLRASRGEIIGRVATINWSDLPIFSPAEVFRGGHFYLLEQVHEAPDENPDGGSQQWAPTRSVPLAARHWTSNIHKRVLTYFTILDSSIYLYNFIQGTSVHLCTHTYVYIYIKYTYVLVHIYIYIYTSHYEGDELDLGGLEDLCRRQ